MLTSEEVNLLTSSPTDHLEELYRAMERSGRLFFLEVGCCEDSVLSAEVEKVGLEAQRASLFNQCDITDPCGLRRVLKIISQRKPLHVWISSECGAFSPFQNLNQRSEDQVRALEHKQREARKQHVAALVVGYWARYHGSHVHWEWARRCRAWKWPLMDRWRTVQGTSTAIVGGCRVGLQNPKTGEVIGKEWRVESTSKQFAEQLHLPCLHKLCPGNHTTCEGSLTRRSAYYTPKFAKRVVYYLQKVPAYNRDVPGDECPDMSQCKCHEFKFKGYALTCPACMASWEATSKPQDHRSTALPTTTVPQDHRSNALPTFVGEEVGDQEFGREEKARWLNKIRLLHGATGHGSNQVLKDALTQRKVDPRVVKLVEEFRCSVCEERKRPAPRRAATFEVHPGRWKVMLADGAYWNHPKTGARHVIGLYMDQCSRYLVGKVLVQHKTHLPDAPTYVRFFHEHWQQYFGKPEILRFDAEGTWRSKALDSAFSELGIMLDPIPGDAHWHLSPLERSIAWIKECLSKLSLESPEQDTAALLASAIEAWNNREVVRGFSPRQHALGQAPDPCGRLFETDIQGLPTNMMGNPEGELAQAQRLRTEAEVAFTKWQAQQRLSRAANSRTRGIPEYAPGDLVYYWRTQLQGKHAAGKPIQTGRSAGYAGPARVLALETRRDGDNKVRPSSVVWLVRNNRLLKASVEQLRFASQREQLLHEFDRPAQMPWTMTELAAPLGREEYEDISMEVPRINELEEYGGEPRWAPPTKRVRVKQPTAAQASPGMPTGEVPGQEARPSSSAASAPPRERSRSPIRPDSQYADSDAVLHQSYWSDETAAVAIEIPMPTSRHGWQQASRDLQSYLANALKKKNAEVYERHMDQATRHRFDQAKMVEIKKFLAAKALEALPPDKQPNKSETMRMRWILSWKTDHSGQTSPKARAVILGYQDPLYEERTTYAPTTTRHTRQLMLQYAACQGWHAWKGDVAAAFLQGRECPYDLYCVPTPELCEAMQIPKESVTRLRKACYGLVQAPYEWYETVREYLLSIGFYQCGADPCCWVLHVEGKTRAIISGHVDDFMMTGDPNDPVWTQARKSIQEHFRWGEFELNDFTQCGVQIKRSQNGSFQLSQHRYMENVKEIALSQERRKQRKESTTEREQSQLRALLGALSWHASQIGYRYSAYVSLYLSEVPQSTVETIMEVNTLLHRVRDAAKDPMIIHALGPCEEVTLFAWTDAANHNRRDGGSTGGIFIGAAHHRMEEGYMTEVSPMFWSSSKIQRVCRSPGSAEARAAIDGEDVLYLLRYQWSELCGRRPNLYDADTTVRETRGVLVTDSRNVYDRMQQPYISPNGEQKRVDLELLTLKESQKRTGLDIRWVNAQAMLANSLTKRGEDQQFNRFLSCGCRWKIVDDPEMFSGRERARRGLDGLGEELQTVRASGVSQEAM